MQKGRIEFGDPTFQEYSQASAAKRLPAHEHLRAAASASFRDGFELAQAQPIDMILPCPACGMLHIDDPAPDLCECGRTVREHSAPEEGYPSDAAIFGCNEFKVAWDNPPHKSHLCHGCGLIWRPADVPTNGVAVIKTKGQNDTWRTVEADPGSHVIVERYEA